jgi:hypothetical protein
LEGKLIAVSVIDVLPHGMNCKYHFYDPDYSFLSLGTFSTIQECEIVKFHNQLSPDFKYYYLGFYVHGNSKVNYKANFSPSELLCPVTHKWVPIEKCLPLLDKNKFSQFSDEKVEKVVVHHGFNCDGCKKSNFTGVRNKCLECEDFDFCEDCHKNKSHYDGLHHWKSFDFDVHGPRISVFYGDKIFDLKQFETFYKLKDSSKEKIELFEKSVGEEMVSNIIYFIRETDLDQEAMNEKLNSIMKETKNYTAFSGGGRSLAETKLEEKMELIQEKYEYKVRENQSNHFV